MTPAEWLDLLDKAGTLGVMILNLYMFFTGKVIPRATVDMMLKMAEDRTAKMTQEILHGIREAVQVGIVTGVAEVRRIRKDMEADEK